MIDLSGKFILLFVPNGLGIYGSAIFNELTKRGSIVKIYDERPSKSIIIKAIIRFLKRYYSIFFNNYIKNIIKENKSCNFDYIVVIRGEAFTTKSIVLLKKSFPRAKLILYLWDSVKYTKVTELFKYFDKVLSFDRIDVNEFNGLIHRPLFYLPEYSKISNLPPGDIDLIFIGKLHSDRYFIISKLEKIFKEKGLSTYFYFYYPSRLLFFIKKIFNKKYWGKSSIIVNSDMISVSETVNLLCRARCSLDINHPLQTGLTMRTIEVLGAKRKLITTNEDIKNYEFYNKNNIMIIDRKDPVIDYNFIFSPLEEIEESIYQKYSLNCFIDDLFA